MTVAFTPARAAEHDIDPIFLDRWSPRAFGAAPMTEAELMRILEAARWAPSAINVQPWRFVVALRGDAAWDGLVAALSPNNQTWARHAAALVVLASVTTMVPPGATEPVPSASHAFDTGTAWGFLAVQAHLAGWQTHAMGGFDRAAMAAAVNLPEGMALHAVVAIGKIGDPASLPEALRAREMPNSRRPLGASVQRGAFAPA